MQVDDEQKNNFKHGLGRGLDSLIPIGEEYEEPNEQATNLISISNIDPNPHQPRQDFDDDALAELAASIREYGIIQPLLVTKEGSRYQLVAGERRLRAAKIAGLDKVPAVVKSMDDILKLELALIENIQRENLNPIEAAFSYKKLIDNFNLTQEEVAKKVGKARSTVANTLRLLLLPINIRAALIEGKISEGHGRALLNIEDPDKQQALFNRILEGDVTVRQAEKKKFNASLQSKTEKNPDLIAAEKRMSESFGTKVSIKQSKKRGQIIIEYYSVEDLERIYRKIIGN